MSSEFETKIIEQLSQINANLRSIDNTLCSADHPLFTTNTILSAINGSIEEVESAIYKNE